MPSEGLNIMIYNTLLVKYQNSWQLRSYQFPIRSDEKEPLPVKDQFEIFEDEIDKAFTQYDDNYHFEGHSAYVSVNRSKNKIYYYSRSNDWVGGYFVTLEIDQNRFDGRDYKVASDLIRKFTKYLRQHDSSIKALFVPELHPTSGRFHFHGLIKGDIQDILKYSGHIIGGHMVYNFIRGWDYGFTNVTKVKNTLAVEKYICKYTTKELLNSTLYQHRYFVLNLNEAPMLKYNLYNHQELFKELIAQDLVEFCNTDGLYNRCTYCEIKNDDKVLQLIEKYVNLSIDLENF